MSTAIVLVNNATDTEWFATLDHVASAVCFSRGRVNFWQPNPDIQDKNGPLQGQAVIYVGDARENFRDHWFD